MNQATLQWIDRHYFKTEGSAMTCKECGVTVTENGAISHQAWHARLDKKFARLEVKK